AMGERDRANLRLKELRQARPQHRQRADDRMVYKTTETPLAQPQPLNDDAYWAEDDAYWTEGHVNVVRSDLAMMIDAIGEEFVSLDAVSEAFGRHKRRVDRLARQVRRLRAELKIARANNVTSINRGRDVA